MNKTFRTIEHTCDLCVVGGGLSGTIAALSAARKGLQVVLIQDRPVLGGNSSSEIRMWVRGAQGYWNRETGILTEFEEENIYSNPTLAPSLWDSVLFGKVKENENITLLLNTSVLDAECSDDTIHTVTGWQLTTYSWHKVKAKYFADCSGDSVLAPLSGALHRIGREANDEFNEKIGPKVADSKTMGMSIMLQARETDHPVKFIPPQWAYVYENDDDFDVAASKVQYSQKRDHKIGTSGGNLWWIELGGDSEAIANTEDVRDELLKIALGIWDHIKNQGDHGYENWELEWVGSLPGKRESVRYIGEHILTQNDIESAGHFDDVVAYGGWSMDDHNPKGFYANSADEKASVMYPAPSPYGIPYRCLYSKNIKNLFFAGRNISATHAAMSSTRVMGTCSLLGQAMGNAAAICFKNNLMPEELKGGYVKLLQKEIMDDGVFLPYNIREISSVSKEAKLNISSQERDILFSGIERPRSEGDNGNKIQLDKGESISYSFDEPKRIKTLRIQFDMDFERLSVSPNRKMRIFAQKLHYGLDFVPVKVAKTIVKDIEVYADDKLIYENSNNYYSLLKIDINKDVRNITVRFNDTHGAEKINIYACDFI